MKSLNLSGNETGLLVFFPVGKSIMWIAFQAGTSSTLWKWFRWIKVFDFVHFFCLNAITSLQIQNANFLKQENVKNLKKMLLSQMLSETKCHWFWCICFIPASLASNLFSSRWALCNWKKLWLALVDQMQRLWNSEKTSVNFYNLAIAYQSHYLI